MVMGHRARFGSFSSEGARPDAALGLFADVHQRPQFHQACGKYGGGGQEGARTGASHGQLLHGSGTNIFLDMIMGEIRGIRARHDIHQ